MQPILLFGTAPLLTTVGAFSPSTRLSSATLPRATFRWPGIVALHRTFFVSPAVRAPASLDIEGVDGRPKHRLQCYAPGAERSPDDPYPDHLYSGEFDCHLDPLYGAMRHTETLLLSRGTPGGEACLAFRRAFPLQARQQSV